MLPFLLEKERLNGSMQTSVFVGLIYSTAKFIFSFSKVGQLVFSISNFPGALVVCCALLRELFLLRTFFLSSRQRANNRFPSLFASVRCVQNGDTMISGVFFRFTTFFLLTTLKIIPRVAWRFIIFGVDFTAKNKSPYSQKRWNHHSFCLIFFDSLTTSIFWEFEELWECWEYSFSDFSPAFPN